MVRESSRRPTNHLRTSGAELIGGIPGTARLRLVRGTLLFAAVVFPPFTRAAEVDVSAAEHVKPARPVIPSRTFSLVDFGGVGKEYAADRAATICADHGIVHGLDAQPRGLL